MPDVIELPIVKAVAEAVICSLVELDVKEAAYDVELLVPMVTVAFVSPPADFVNVWLATSLSVMPLFTAMAFTVVVAVIAIGEEYVVDELVGVLPSVV